MEYIDEIVKKNEKKNDSFSATENEYYLNDLESLAQLKKSEITKNKTFAGVQR